jgi:hypothetical protein
MQIALPCKEKIFHMKKLIIFLVTTPELLASFEVSRYQALQPLRPSDGREGRIGA